MYRVNVGHFSVLIQLQYENRYTPRGREKERDANGHFSKDRAGTLRDRSYWWPPHEPEAVDPSCTQAVLFFC